MSARSVLFSIGAVMLSVLALPAAAAAQNVGVLVGVNNANVDFKSSGITFGADAKTGIVGGVTVSPNAGKMVGVEVDGLLSMKGTKFNFGGGDAGTMSLTYVDVPVMARVNVPLGASSHVHILAGPSFDFKVHESFDPEQGNDDSGIKQFETAFVVGGGVTANRFRVDVRYEKGLTSFVDEDESGFTAKNKVISVLFGVELR